MNEALRTSSLKTMKKQLDSAMQEIRAAEELIGKIPSKGYPSSMCEWFQTGCASRRAQHSEILKYYIDAMSEIPGTPWDADRLAASNAAIDEKLKQFSNHVKSFQLGTVKDVKNLVGPQGPQTASPSKDKAA